MNYLSTYIKVNPLLFYRKVNTASKIDMLILTFNAIVLAQKIVKEIIKYKKTCQVKN